MVGHGGLAIKAATRVVRNKAAYFLSRGYIFVSVNTRLLPQADVAGQRDDVVAALVFVQQQAARWGGDRSHLVLMGHSAGGHLVALISADPEPVMRAGGSRWQASVILDSAVLNVPEIMQNKHFGLYDRAFGTDQSFWVKLSPIDHVQASAVPMLLVCSSRRRDACPQAQDFAAQLNSHHVQAQVLALDLTHGDINDTLGLPGAYTNQVDAFITDRLSGK